MQVGFDSRSDAAARVLGGSPATSSTQYHGDLARPPVKWILGDVIFP